MKNSTRITLLIYGWSAVLTFGHAWTHTDLPEIKNPGDKSVASGMCAVFWPLYWSVKFWEKP